MFDNIHGIGAIYQGPRRRVDGIQRWNTEKRNEQEWCAMVDEVEEEKTKKKMESNCEWWCMSNWKTEQIKQWRKRPKTEQAKNVCTIEKEMPANTRAVDNILFVSFESESLFVVSFFLVVFFIIIIYSLRLYIYYNTGIRWMVCSCGKSKWKLILCYSWIAAAFSGVNRSASCITYYIVYDVCLYRSV